MAYGTKYRTAGGIKFDLKGEPELNAFFTEILTEKQRISIEKSAFRRMARPIVTSARRRIAPRKITGTLSRSADIYPFRKKAGVYVGFKRTGELRRGVNRKTFKGKDGFYAHMVDRGTRGNSGLNFWEPSVSENLDNIGHNMQLEQLQALKKFVDRKLKQQSV